MNQRSQMNTINDTESRLYIGLMSGTSLDGVDASLIKTDGTNSFYPLCNTHIYYDKNFKHEIQKVLNNYYDQISCDSIATILTKYHIDIVHQLLDKANIHPNQVSSIGFHGQTIYHNPARKITKQIGDPNLLSQKTNIDVIYDFRSQDVSLGGQGAPLAPIFHQCLMYQEKKPVAIVNIGGVANITYIEQQNLIAFDTGPGNAIIDDLMLEYFNEPYDDNGAIAAQGTVANDIISSMLQDDYLSMPYPKSLDRNHFHYIINKIKCYDHLKPSDAVATATYFTAFTIANGITSLPQIPCKVYLSGGGSYNNSLLNFIKLILSNTFNVKIPVVNISTKSQLDPKFIESQAFAYLAARYERQLPSSFPMTTGVMIPNICGKLVKKPE